MTKFPVNFRQFLKIFCYTLSTFIAFQNCTPFQTFDPAETLGQNSPTTASNTTNASTTDTAAVAPPPVSEISPRNIEASVGGVSYYGRFDFSDARGAKFNWSGSSVVVRFHGTSVSVNLNSSGSFFIAVVDGSFSVRFKTTGSKNYPIANNLSIGDHTVLLFRESEATAGVSQFLGFDLGVDGSALPQEAPKSSVRLEFIGDSITCGYGNIGTSPCGFSYDTESAFNSYAQKTAELLGAPPATNICQSGHGIVRSYGSSEPSPTNENMPTQYLYTLQPNNGTPISSKWKPSAVVSERPSVIVINLGTNDYWDQKQPALFTETYLSFVTAVRAQNPNAHIFCVMGVLTDLPSNAVQDVVKRMNSQGDVKVHYVGFSIQSDTNGLGCDYHPSQKTNSLMAAQLASVIRRTMGL